MSERETPLRARRHREAGFTLVEALIAVVILIFGLMGVTNLMIVAASSNSAANQGTAAATVASQVLERLKAVPFTGLTAGGDTATDTGSAGPCFGTGAVSVANPSTLNNCDADMQGVGRIHARWSLTGLGGNRQVYFVQVSAEATGGLGPGRTRAAFTTFRSCTGTVTQGCPLP